MLFDRGGALLTKNRVTLGCIVLVASASASSFIYDSTHDKRLINLIDSAGKIIAEFFSGSEQAGGGPMANNSFSIVSLLEQVKPYWTMASSWATTSFYSLPSLIEGGFNFFKSFTGWGMFKKLFEKGGLHMKLWNLIDLANNETKRKLFAKLFEDDRYQKTINTARLLFWDPTGEIRKYFSIGSNLLTYLLLRFAEDPIEITRKFQRLSDMFDKILATMDSDTKKISQLEGKETYSLTMQKLQAYLRVKQGGCNEDFFEHTWWLSILKRQETGSDLNALQGAQRTSKSFSQFSDCSLWALKLTED